MPKVSVPSAPAEAEPMQKTTILVVADVEPIIFTLRQFLTEHGYKVVNAKTGDHALAMLSSTSGIKIVVCDLALRGTNRIQLLRDVRRISCMNDKGSWPPPKFIFVGVPKSYASDAECLLREKAVLISEGHVIDKPIDKDDLLRRIQGLGEENPEAAPRGTKLPAQVTSRFASGRNDLPAIEQIQKQQTRLGSEIFRLDGAHQELDQRVDQLHARIIQLEESMALASMPAL